MDERFELLKEYVKRLAIYYGKNFGMPVEDLFQEGFLAYYLNYERYKSLPQKEFVLVMKKIVNRSMYKLVKEEIKRRTKEISFEEE